jgi:hypothetical protein
MNAARAKVVAYVILLLIAGWSGYRSEQAISLARTVDHRGDIRACTQENLIRSESNGRNAVLEKTARLVVDSLGVIRAAPRPPGDNTNIQLAKLAKRSRKLQTNFARAKMINCEKVFPAP